MIGTDYRCVSGQVQAASPYLSTQMADKSREVECHSSWRGSLGGIKCEELLRGQPNGTYVIRHAEELNTYYISWVKDTEQCLFGHQPFSLISERGTPKWLYKNGYDKLSDTLDDLIPLMMHRPKESCFAILK
jgi:hypothetical protein